MQALRFLPLGLVAGIDGFAMFLPYLGLVWTTAFVLAWIKARRPQPAVA